MSDDKKTPWNSLEVAKLAADISTPLMIAPLAFGSNQHWLDRMKHGSQVNVSPIDDRQSMMRFDNPSTAFTAISTMSEHTKKDTLDGNRLQTKR